MSTLLQHHSATARATVSPYVSVRAMNRRLFLGLVGGTMAAAATPKAFWQIARSFPPVSAGTRYVSEFVINASVTGCYELRRANRPDCYPPLFVTGLHANSMLRWVTVPGEEIILLPEDPMLVISGPGVPTWTILWHDEQGERFMANSKSAIIYPLNARLGARARRRRNRAA